MQNKLTSRLFQAAYFSSALKSALSGITFLAVAAAFMVLSSFPSIAQQTSGAISGTILDSSGAGIPNATVTVRNEATGIEANTTSTSAGQYRLDNLLVGNYTLTADASGFTKSQVQHVSVDVNKVATANLTLQIGAATTSVTVTESAATIDTTTAQIQTTFSPRQLATLPIGSSTSGVINVSLLASGVASGGSVGVGTGPSVGGQRPRNNNFMIEGIDDNNKSTTGPLVSVPNDDTAEFSLLQNDFSPEYGHSNGGQFNTIVKSGTNQFHGMLYEYVQNKNFDANDQLFANQGILSHPRYDYNRLGANFGGPVLKNKLFFFVGFEYNPIGQASTPGTIFAPTAAGYTTLGTVSGLSPTNLGVLQKYLGAAPAATAASALPTGAYPVVGGKTIESGILPIAAPNYMNYYTGVSSVDYNISDKDQLRGRFIYGREDAIDNYAQLPVFYTTQPYRDYLVNVSEFHDFTPTLANELRLGYTRYYNITPSGSINFPGLDAFPNLRVDEYQVDIGPDDNAPQETIINTYQLVDNLSWVKGAHTFKFGFNGYKYISPQSFTQRVRGDYEWSTLQNYLQDLSPDVAGERSAGDSIYYGDQFNFGFYGNDDWKINPNLTVNIGLRYEYTTIPYGERAQALNAVSNVPGLITFGVPQPQKTNFMPRVGFAYSPGTTGKTVFRGGFAIGYDVLFDNLGILSLPPQLQQTNDTSTTNITPNFLATGGLPGSNVALTPALARAQTAGYIPDQQLPKALNWNLGVQHVFGQNYTFEARYLGTRGINLPVQDRINIQALATPGHSLPTFFTAPTQAQLNALPLTLDQLESSPTGNILPAYYNAGFMSNITAYEPIGNSTYHGLATSLNRRFSSGLQFIASYTWSHNIDDSTAEVFSTLVTPRRPQDFQDLRADRSDSALDHRQRASLAIVYDFKAFKNHNWFMRNLVSNWEVAPVYTFQSGTWATLQSSIDANLNNDSYGDRAIVNPSGRDGVGSDATPLTNSAGATVAYLATNPNARYVSAQPGTYPNVGRNTLQMPPIQNLDLTAVKRFNISERYAFEFQAQASNVFNHAQYVGGFINDVGPVLTGLTGDSVRQYVNPASSTFNNPSATFSSNPRTLTLVAKFTF